MGGDLSHQPLEKKRKSPDNTKKHHDHNTLLDTPDSELCLFTYSSLDELTFHLLMEKCKKHLSLNAGPTKPWWFTIQNHLKFKVGPQWKPWRGGGPEGTSRNARCPPAECPTKAMGTPFRGTKNAWIDGFKVRKWWNLCCNYGDLLLIFDETNDTYINHVSCIYV